MKKTIINILERLEQSNYVDPAEHLYDAIKVIKRHLDDNDLEYYIHDFLWGLESSTVIDCDDVVKECSVILKNIQSFINVNKELPDKTQKVEVLVNGNICECVFYNEKSNLFPNGFFGTHYKMVINDITHWRDISI